jgi:AcrR family transcriptional regulator
MQRMSSAGRDNGMGHVQNENSGRSGQGRAQGTAARGRRRRRAQRRQPLSRQDWIEAARSLLIRSGVDAVRIVPLARALRVTRGGFYWHFKDRDDLLDSLLEYWQRANTAPFEAVLRNGADKSGLKEFQAIVDIWLDEESYSPSWDSAVRDWARVSPRVALVGKEVDGHRIDIIRQIFLDLGYSDPEALVRARIAYFHQVGYYTLHFSEDSGVRRRLAPVYTAALTGQPIPAV